MRNARRLLPLVVVALLLAALGSPSTRAFEETSHDLSTTDADYTIEGDASGDLLGDYRAVASGDFDNDGYDDVLVSAAGVASPLPDGEVYLFSGGPTVLGNVDAASANFTVEGGDGYGLSPVAAGDFNDDGFDDILIGAPGFAGDRGAAFVVFGANPIIGTLDLGSAVADYTVVGGGVGDKLGIAVSAGDVNGDGIDDLLLGADADGDLDDFDQAGEVHVVFGSTTLSGQLTLATTDADFAVLNAHAFDHFGSAVAAGDVNGDGIDDLLVGSYFADSAGGTKIQGGEGYAFFGSTTLSGTVDLGGANADFTIGSVATDDRLGTSVASADVNDDGVDDLILGAPLADSPQPAGNTGAVYVIFGDSGLSGYQDGITLGDFIIYGDDGGDVLGTSVATGEFNGDGVPDIIAGAETADGTDTIPSVSNGEAAVIYGSSGLGGSQDLNTTPADFTLYGAATQDRLGRSVAAGDINRDGIDDAIVGAGQVDGDGGATANTGAAYVLFGGCDTGADVDRDGMCDDFLVVGAGGVSHLGTALASGDFNDDGIDDLLVGANTRVVDGTRFGAGEAYVLFGEGGLSGVVELATSGADFTVQGAATSDRLGTSVAAGDFNDDGIDDLLIGAYLGDGNNDLLEDAGEAHVFFGSPGLSGTVDLAATVSDYRIYGGPDQAGYLGYSVAAGDVNGDGVDDVIVGAYGADGPASARNGAGNAYVLFGSTLFGVSEVGRDLASRPADFAVYGIESEDQMGLAVSSGDVNGDGTDDLLLAAQFADGPANGRLSAGEGYVVFGPLALGGEQDLAADAPDFTVLAADAGDLLSSVAAGDVNGDGTDDLLVGTRTADGTGNARPESGEVHGVFGSAGLGGSLDLNTTAADFAVLGSGLSDQLGFSLSAGDFNGDGIDDMLMGAANADGDGGGFLNAGEADAVFGSSGLSGTQDLGTTAADFRLTGLAALDLAGDAVAAGDLNGDHIDDFIVGAPDADGGAAGSLTGEAYVVFGGCATGVDTDVDGLCDVFDDDDDNDGTPDEVEGQCGDALDDDSNGLVNDGCPQVGASAESGAECTEAPGAAVDDDGDSWINDGCPGASEEAACGSKAADGSSEPERLGNGLDDDGDTLVDEVQPTVAGLDCDGDGYDDDIEAALTWPPADGITEKEEAGQCNDVLDDDGDTIVNDGCPQPGTGHQRRCSDSTSANDEDDDQWPADFNDDGRLSLQDINLFASPIRHFNLPANPNHLRWNLSGGTTINLSDVSVLGTKRPAMFGGQRAWNNSMWGSPGACPSD